MLFHFGDTLAEIDTEATRNYYLTHDAVNACACLGCQNFRQWTKICPPEITEQFQAFGIDDLNVITEIIPFGARLQEYERNHGMLYGGFYHVIGKITKPGENADLKISEHEKFCAEWMNQYPVLFVTVLMFHG